MDILITILGAVLGFTILVGFHEYGHYKTARLAGAKIKEFAIGMGPKIVFWKNRKTGILYSFRLLPLGGFVEFANPNDDSDVVGTQLNDLHPLKRMLIIFNGPFANFILAVVFLSIVNFGSQNAVPSIIGDTTGIAKEAGLEKGDIITRVGAEDIEKMKELAMSILGNLGKKTPVEFIRDGISHQTELDLSDTVLSRESNNPLFLIGTESYLQPSNIIEKVLRDDTKMKAGDIVTHIDGETVQSFFDMRRILAEKSNTVIELSVLRNSTAMTFETKLIDNTLGVQMAPPSENDIDYFKQNIVIEKNGVAGAIREGFTQSVSMTVLTFKTFLMLFNGSVDTNALQGGYSMSKSMGDAFNNSLNTYLTVLAFMSLSLMFINLIPIPVLDGGQLVTTAYEWIVGPINEQFNNWMIKISIVLVLIFMIYVNANDIFYSFFR